LSALRQLAAPTLDEIEAARARLEGIVAPTPLLPLAGEPSGGIYLKLENLQPIGSFKLRGAANALLFAGREGLADGVYTASAGNMAQGVAWSARRLGVRATAVVPEQAPATKLAAIERLGAQVVKVPYERWWQVIEEHSYPGLSGLFVHPVANTAVMAGNGTIALEIAEQLPGVDTVLVPFGGGGLACGIAAAFRALGGGVRVYGCEVDTATPLTASLAAGSAQTVEHRQSFVDGIGGKRVLPEMWPLAKRLLDGSRVVSLAAIAAAIRLLAERNRVIAEGAGAAAVAAALAPGEPGAIQTMSGSPDAIQMTPGPPGAIERSSDPSGSIQPPSPAVARPARGQTVCIVSGGNIDAGKLAAILSGELP
jgi:threonine dehydratase